MRLEFTTASIRNKTPILYNLVLTFIYNFLHNIMLPSPFNLLIQAAEYVESQSKLDNSG